MNPEPHIMPIQGDRQEWRKNLYLINFVNTYYLLRDIESVCPKGKILVVGSGKGLDKPVLQWRGYDVTTLDIDTAFEPDVVGSVHDLSVFTSQQFDCVVASHVLEHLPVCYLDQSLSELSRVARFSVIYLPWTGRRIEARLTVWRFDWRICLQVHNPLHKPDGLSPNYMAGQHYWEVGMRGFSKRDIIRRASPFLKLRKVYRNPDRTVSCNYIFESLYSDTPKPSGH